MNPSNNNDNNFNDNNNDDNNFKDNNFKDNNNNESDTIPDNKSWKQTASQALLTRALPPVDQILSMLSELQ